MDQKTERRVLNENGNITRIARILDKLQFNSLLQIESLVRIKINQKGNENNKK